MNNKIFKKRGVSPVVATVLLIAMVIVIALIIFLWFRGMARETITKFDGTNIELVCGDVKFEASYSGGILYVSNIGNVPIYGMKIKISGDGSHVTKDLKDISTWLDTGLNQGGTFSGDISTEVGTAKEITLIPVLIGTSEKGDKTYVCDEKQHGYEIITY